MKKFISMWTSILIGLVTLLGSSGLAFGQETYSYTHLANDGKGSKTEWTYVEAPFLIKQYKKTSTSDIAATYAELRVYMKHALTISPAKEGAKISKIVFTTPESKYANALAAATIKVGKNASEATIEVTPTIDNFTVTLDLSAQADIGFVEITVNETTRVSKIEIFYTLPCADPSIPIAVVEGKSVSFSWTASDPAPALGYAVSVTKKEGEAIKRDTVKSGTSYTLADLEPGEYVCSVQSLCSELLGGVEKTTPFKVGPSISPNSETFSFEATVGRAFSQTLAFTGKDITDQISIALLTEDGPTMEVTPPMLSVANANKENEIVFSCASGDITTAGTYTYTLNFLMGERNPIPISTSTISLKVKSATDPAIYITNPTINEEKTIEKIPVNLSLENIATDGSFSLKAEYQGSHEETSTTFEAGDITSTSPSFELPALATGNYELSVSVYSKAVPSALVVKSNSRSFTVKLATIPSNAVALSTVGGTYTAPVEVGITLKGGRPPYYLEHVYYTLDGTEPTTSSTELEADTKITIAKTSTLKYYIKAVDCDPYLGSAEYIINIPKTNKVAFTPNPGAFVSKTTISLSCATEGAAVRYTTDGTTPTIASTLYSAPFDLTATTTLKALAYKDGIETLNDSIKVGTYTLISIEPIALPTGATALATMPAKGWYNGGLGTDYGADPKMKFGDQGDFLMVAFNAPCETLKYSIKHNAGANGLQFDVETSADGANWAYLKSYSLSDLGSSIKAEEITNIPSTVRYIRWVYTTKTAGNIALGPISIEGASSDPQLKIEPSSLNLGNFAYTIGMQKKDTVALSGKNLTQAVTLKKIYGSDHFTLSAANLTAAQIMQEDGYLLGITWAPLKAGKDTAFFEIGSTEMKDTLCVYAESSTAELVKNVAELYTYYDNVSSNPEKIYQLGGDVVVTHIDVSGKIQRAWVQDTVRNGRSILIYNDQDKTKVDITEGGLLERGWSLRNIPCKLNLYNKALQMIPAGAMVAEDTKKTPYVDTVSMVQLKANPLLYQHKLVSIEGVAFVESGTMAAGKSYRITKNADTLVFRTDYKTADYIGETFPTGKINMTGILAQFNDNIQITARDASDMMVPPCVLPQSVSVSTTATTATISFESEADSTQYRYAFSPEALEAATVVGIKTKSFKIEGLSESTTYYYQLKSICSPTSSSPWSDARTFATTSSSAPSLTIITPKPDSVFTGLLSFAFETQNFTISEATGWVLVMLIRGEDTTRTFAKSPSVLLSHTPYPSGDYKAICTLYGTDGGPITPLVTAQVYFKVDLPNVATPTFTPAAGFYTQEQSVSIESETPSARIYYTLDGTTPNSKSSLYTSSLTISQTTTLKAIAFKEEMDSSAVSTAEYTLLVNPTPEGDLILAEGFYKCTEGSMASPGGEITATLDKYTVMPGWTGAKVYSAGGTVKMSTSSALGYLQLPNLDLSQNQGKFYVVFKAQAWVGDATSLKLIVNGQTTEVKPLANGPVYGGDDFREFVYLLENGTASTSIRFEAQQAAKGRFFLDTIQIYQVLPQVPTITVAAKVEIATVQGVSLEKDINVKGKLLTENISIACPSGNFSIKTTSLPKEEVMKANGANFSVAYNGNKVSDSVVLTLSSGSLTKTVQVYGTATAIVEVDNLAALKEGTDGSYYKVKGEVILSAMDINRNTKWLQDASAGIMIDDGTGIITSSYQIGDGFTGVIGKLGSFGGQKQWSPIQDFGAASSQGNEIVPIEVTIDQLKESAEANCARLVEIKSLSLLDKAGVWESNKDHLAVVGEDTINIRTFVRNGNFVGEAKPQDAFDLVALVGLYNGAVQVSPRTQEDITTTEEDPCAVPTNLKVTNISISSATLSFEGMAPSYEISYKTEGEAENLVTVTEKTYGLKDLKANTTYLWKVRAICSQEQKSEYSAENSFKTKAVANEELSEIQAYIYPNPSNGNFTVKVPASSVLEFYSLSGNLVKKIEVGAGSHALTLSQSGVYFIRISSQDKVVVKRMVVK